MKTLYRVFDSSDQASRAYDELTLAGFPADQISILCGSADGQTMANLYAIDVPGGGQMAANAPMRDRLASDSDVRGALTWCGVPTTELDACAQALQNGAAFEAIMVEDTQADDARAILERGEEVVVPLIQEDLTVGTREVEAGGVRVTSHVREFPVEKQVTIHEERVTVERRTVDRPLDEEPAAFRDQDLEVRGITEEPVIRKRARVTEEIRLHKDRSEQLQNVDDTVRHTEIAVTDLPAQQDFSTQAHALGEELHYRSTGRDFAAVEAEAKAAWERERPGTWDRVRDAVRAGFEGKRV
jgi:uncharacterized protein (TIGR02271 family)